jgi:hypothetical protein
MQPVFKIQYPMKNLNKDAPNTLFVCTDICKRLV